jgi:HrpA-like RNA helicase
VSPEDQARIYERTNKGTGKIVISTNICETSVTGRSASIIYFMLLFLHLYFAAVPDVTAVIDSGRAKLVQFNARRAIREFNDVFADTSSLRQRQGRAGRVREGICFKLYFSSAYSAFPSHAIPKLRRCPLSGLMLQMRVAAAASSCLFTISNFVSSGVTCNLAASIRVSSRCAQL